MSAGMQTGSKEWMDEIINSGCYRCGHEASESDPCDEECDGLLPLSWSQMQEQRKAGEL